MAQIIFLIQGALIGYVCGIGITSWICVGAILHPSGNTSMLPLSTNGCILETINLTTVASVTPSVADELILNLSVNANDNGMNQTNG